MQRRGRFLDGSTMGHVARMTLTGAMGITFVFLVDLANLFWLSQIGEPILIAAIGFAFAIQFFTVQIGVGLMIAATAVISRRIGMDDPERARHEATASAVLSVLAQTIVTVLVVVFRVPLLELVGATGETLALASRYLLISMPSLIIMAAGMAGQGALRAEGEGRRSMYVTLTSGAVAMMADPFLILGLELGLDGAAWGVVLSRVVMVVQALRFAIIRHDLFAPPALWAVRRAALPFVAVALPAILTQMAAPFGNYLLTGVIAGFGDAAVAAWAVVNRVTVVAFGGIFSLSGAIGGIFGQNYGARLHDRLRMTYRDAMMFCAAYTFTAWMLLLVSMEYVIDGFGLPPDGAEVYKAFARIGAGSFIFIGAFFVSNAAFNNLGKPGRSTLVNWLRDGVLILPAAWWLADLAGAPGVVYAQALVGGVMGIVSALWGWWFLRRFDAPPAQGA
ncbi:putative efflux protein, MATE family [Salinihabitans flavidus]|uniref:Putative efflux protein, MATE family n=1 Tax=Salinihabitans flavidus TaxID=569882 RepID=A0A1H8VFF4_9RHOB|nr:MATE family efflux transporter [Salinihabitans flavidus]SEP13937.1 putative efflux protein, MATE family [Salinihabitans flavidus]